MENSYQKLLEDQRKHYEYQNRLSKKIQEKEKTLQEKLLKIEEKLRNIQPKTTFGYKVKREKKKDLIRMDRSFYCTQNGISDCENIRESTTGNIIRKDKSLYCTENCISHCENPRERTTGNIRNEGQREKTRERDQGSSNKDKERWKKVKTGMKHGQLVREQAEIEWENWGRNTERTKGEKDEQDYYKELRKQGRSNKDVERREQWKVHQERQGDGMEQNWGKNPKKTTGCKMNLVILQGESDLCETVKKQKCTTARIKQEKMRKREVAQARNETKEQEWRDYPENVNNEERVGRARVWSSVEKTSEDKQNFTNRGKSKSVENTSLTHDKIKAFTVRKGDQSATHAGVYQNGLGIVQEKPEASNITNTISSKPLTKPAPQPPNLKQKGNVRYLQCKICHRSFSVDRLETHIRICEKIACSHHKVFDSSKQRVKGTSLEEFMKTNKHSKTPELKNNWRQKHGSFIRNMQQARAPAKGGFQSQTRVEQNPDYVSCPHCSRRFAPGPAERHIPKCQNIRSKPPPPPKHR